MDIFPFLATKMMLIGGFVFLFGWPLVLIGCFAGGLATCDYTSRLQIWIVWTIFTLIAIILYTAYCVEITRPATRSVYSKLGEAMSQSYEEFKNEIEKPQPVRIDEAVELRRFELLDWNPPKHFYVTLEDVKTHRVFKHKYVSKHCNGAASLRVGDEYNIPTRTYKLSNDPSTVYTELTNLSTIFCGGE